MAKRRAAALVLAAVLFVGLALPAHAQDVQAGRFALGQFDVPCRAAILIDQESGTVLYEKEADTRMPIASITKVMTLLLVMEGLEEGRFTLEDTVPVTEHAYSMGGSQIWLEPGEQFTVDEMLRAVCVASANDAAVALAEMVGGSEPVFVEQMNRKAAQLGMTGTTFKNACGLDEEGHLSTARDVAIMSREMLNRHPQILNYTGIWTDSLRDGQQADAALSGNHRAENRNHRRGGSLPFRQCHPGRSVADRGGVGRVQQRRAVRCCHRAAGLRLCQFHPGRGPRAGKCTLIPAGEWRRAGNRGADLPDAGHDSAAKGRERGTEGRA